MGAEPLTETESDYDFLTDTDSEFDTITELESSRAQDPQRFTQKSFSDYEMKVEIKCS